MPATVALGAGCPDETVQAMAARLQEALDALAGKLPEHRDKLARALTHLLGYRNTVAREAWRCQRAAGRRPGHDGGELGTEITFSHPSLHGLFVDPDEKCDKKALAKSQQAARGYLDEWAKAVVRMFPTDRKKVLVLEGRARASPRASKAPCGSPSRPRGSTRWASRRS